MKRFYDFKCFGGWLTIVVKPCLLAWWSKDATPPTETNQGKWFIGNYKKAVERGAI